jgi:hypothetical protein
MNRQTFRLYVVQSTLARLHSVIEEYQQLLQNEQTPWNEELGTYEPRNFNEVVQTTFRKSELEQEYPILERILYLTEHCL